MSAYVVLNVKEMVHLSDLAFIGVSQSDHGGGR